MSAESLSRRQYYVERIEKEGPKYMNNFFGRVPLPNDGHEDRRLLGMADFPGFDPDKPFGDFYQSDNSKYWQGEEKHSSMFWSLTPRKYFKLIDDTLEVEVGLNKIHEIQRSVDERRYPIEMNRACESAYLKLVEMGFTWRDLSS